MPTVEAVFKGVIAGVGVEVPVALPAEPRLVQGNLDVGAGCERRPVVATGRVEAQPVVALDLGG
ncbi:MAG: hypothetical protein ACOC1T_00500 [Halorhodospira sp.]